MADLRAVHALAGDLMSRIPDDVGIHSWELMSGYVGAQIDPDRTPGERRRMLALLAHTFNLAYDESNYPSFDQVNAQGAVDDVRVQFYTHIDHPTRGRGVV